MPVTSEAPAPTAKEASYWWLTAVLLPIGSFGMGIILGLSAPANENDWTGGGFAVRYFATLTCGCALGVAAAVISFRNREKRAALSLITTIPSLLFIAGMAVSVVRSPAEAKRQAISTAQSYKKEADDLTQKNHWKAELRTHPELITSDEFWKAHQEPARNAEWGLIWLLQDQAFVVTPEIRAYVIKNFPRESSTLFQTKRFTVAELQAMAGDQGVDHGLRASAIQALFDDEAFDFSAEWKALVRHQFPELVHLLVSGKKLTKAELEELARDSKTSEQVKRDIQFYLQRGYFKP